MDQKYRLMCESWVEKRPEVSQITVYGTSSRKQSIKWKTRYAMLVVSCETRSSELKFYQKKPRSCTEITDDVIRLKPWQYIVDIPSWIVDKGRPHVLRLRLLPESIVPGQHFRLQIAYQSAEEATAWMRCIQNQTKLTSGIQGHSFGLVAEECSATARIGVAGKHCLLFVSPQKVILAHKTDRSVVCVWPFETIRSYATDDDRRLVIEAGRCAPLGDGVYSFRTRENDDNVIFDLFDHYTSQPVEDAKAPKNKVKRNKSNATISDQTISSPVAIQSPVSSSGKSRNKMKNKQSTQSPDNEVIPLLTTWSNNSTPEDYAVPPEKPPLPENRKTLPFSLAKSQSELRDEVVLKLQKNRPVSYAEIVETPSRKNTLEKTSDKNRNSVLKGCNDLDKILLSLEGPCNPKTEKQVSENCYDQPATSEVLERRKSEMETHASDVSDTTKLELAYEVNTLKSDIVLSVSELENQPSLLHEVTSEIPDSNFENSFERKKTKPKVAPKPASVKIPKSVVHSYSSKSTEPLPDKPFPPYAKIDQDKKRKSGIA